MICPYLRWESSSDDSSVEESITIDGGIGIETLWITEKTGYANGCAGALAMSKYLAKQTLR